MSVEVSYVGHMFVSLFTIKLSRVISQGNLYIFLPHRNYIDISDM